MASMALIPSRHGRDIELQRGKLGWLRKALPIDPEPNAEEWSELGQALQLGDAPLDELVAWMMEAGFQKTKVMYDKASREGIAAIEDAPEELKRFFAVVEATPAWTSQQRLIEGQQASALAGRIGNYVLRDLVLIGGYQLSAVNKTLIATGALQKNAVNRLIETNKWFLDCMTPGGMAKFSPGYVSTLQIRLIHGLVRRQVTRSKNWDLKADGLPINQLDMHNTYLGHSVVYLLGIKLLGVPLNEDERQGVMDLWRYIGWLMGVEEKRLHVHEVDGLIGLYRNSLSQPGPDESSRILASALTDEPLSIRYGRFPKLNGVWSRAVHLSIVRTFLGKKLMADMGMPAASPWYPILTGPTRFIGHKLVRALGGRNYLVRRGHAQQLDELKIRSGQKLPTRFAPHIQTAAQSATV
jgi:hypothetical protein